MAIIYKHIRLDCNEVFYIGIGNCEKRAYSKSCRNKYWNNITNKTNYEIQILKNDLTWEDACELEIILIEYYGRKDLGKGTLVNLTNGGDGFYGGKHSEETKNIMRNTHLNQSDLTRYNRSIAQLGKKLSKETINKIIKNSKRSKKVIDTITGEIWDSAKILADIKNINYCTLIGKLNINNKIKNNTTFKYFLEEDVY